MTTPSDEYVSGFTLEPSPPERSVPSLTQPLRENIELVDDLTRYAEGIYSESAVRKKWRLSEEAWELLGNDDELVRAIEEAKIRRVRSGALKRELAQGHVVRGVGVLAEIMDNPKESARHRVDSIKTLDSLAANGPKDTPEQEKIIIRIDLGADLRAAGKEPNPGDVITIEAEPRPKTPKQLEGGNHSEQPSDDEWRR
jgi:hypothetical protein